MSRRQARGGSRLSQDGPSPAFRQDVNQLAAALRAQLERASTPDSLYWALTQVTKTLNAKRPALIEHLLRSDAWRLLLNWLRLSSDQLLAARAPALAAEAAASAAPAAGAAGANRGGPSAATHASAIYLLEQTFTIGSIAACDGAPFRSEAAAAAAAPPATACRMLLASALLAGLRALLASHGIRDVGRLAAQAADAAVDALAADTPFASSAAPTAAGYRVSGLAGRLESYCNLLIAAAGAAVRLSQHRLLQLPLQPVAPAVGRSSSSASGVRGGGRSGRNGIGRPGGGAAGGRGSSRARPACGGGGGSGGGDAAAASEPQSLPLLPLLLSEAAASGLLDHSARLAMAQAVAAGRRRLQQLPPGTEQDSQFQADCLLRSINNAMICMAGASPTAIKDSQTAGQKVQRQASLLPLPWGAPLQMLALSQVVATLGAAGFGGGQGGVWGLPAELAAGLPLVGASPAGAGQTEPDLRMQPPAAGEVGYLSTAPFVLLSLFRPPPAPGGSSSTSSSSGSSSTSSSASTSGGGWQLPVGPCALAKVMLAMADLALASCDNATSTASTAAAAAATGAGTTLLLRLPRAGAWEVGLEAVTAARTELLRRTGGCSTDSDGGSGNGSEPRWLPVHYWRRVAAVLRACTSAGGRITSAGQGSSDRTTAGGGSSAAVVNDREQAGQQEAPSEQWQAVVLGLADEALRLGALGLRGPELPPALPRALAAPLAAGLLPALEACLRTAPFAELATTPLATFLQLPAADAGVKGASWPLFQALLAFAPPAAMANLVTSLGKRLHAALDEAERQKDAAAAAAAGKLAGGHGSRQITEHVAMSILPYPKASAPERPSLAAASRARSSSGDAGAGSSTNSTSSNVNGSSSGTTAAANPTSTAAAHQRRLRRLFSHALHRLLPPLSRAVRSSASMRVTQTNGYVQLLFLLSLALRELATAEARVAAAAQVSGSARGPSCAAGGGAAAAAAAAAGCGGDTAAATCVAAAAAAASWRQWLLHDVEVVALAELGLRLLAELPPGDEHEVVLGVQGFLVQLCMAMPDALAPALQLPPSERSPWHPASLLAVFRRHIPTAQGAGYPISALLVPLELFNLIRDDMAEGADGPRLRASALGGPANRAAIAQRQAPDDALAGDAVCRKPLSPYEAQAAASQEAALAGVQRRRGHQLSAGGCLLRCCANPRCTNLAGQSEAELPLSACAGCKRVWYCGRACQTAHWRGGHKEACAVLKRQEG